MSREWQFFNFDKRERLQTEDHLAMFFVEGAYPRLVNLLWPAPMSVILDKVIFERKHFPSGDIGTISEMQHGSVATEEVLSRRSPLTLDKLCLDVIFIIFEKLDTLEDVIRLALTSPILWTIGKQRLCALRRESLVLWAGCRVACIGSSVYDTPPGLFSNTDLINLKTWVMNSLEEDWKKDIWQGLYDFLCGTFTIKNVRWLQCHFAVGSVEQLVADTFLGQPQPESPVFRNLTKREYIREDKDMELKISDFNFDYAGTIDCGMLFEKVLLAQICWSALPSSTMGDQGVLYRGQWAGDRLDCVEMQYFERERSDDHDRDKSELRPWKDITQEAWAFLMDVYTPVSR